MGLVWIIKCIELCAFLVVYGSLLLFISFVHVPFFQINYLIILFNPSEKVFYYIIIDGFFFIFIIVDADVTINL